MFGFSEGIEIGKKVVVETLVEALYATPCLFAGSVGQTEIMYINTSGTHCQFMSQPLE